MQLATGLASGNAVLGGQSREITAADPASIGQVLGLAVTRGSLRDLGPGSLAVSSKAAAGQHWTVGSRVPVTYPDGTTAALRVAAIFDHPDKMGPARAACTVDTRIRVLANTGALACTPRRLTTWPLS